MKGFETFDQAHCLKLRGGRLTKWRGKVATMAPALLALAMAVPMLLHAPAAQAACNIVGNVATCSGNDTAEQVINFTGPGDKQVNFAANYSVDSSASGGDGVRITSDAQATSLSIADDSTDPATIVGQQRGLEVVYQGLGDVTATLNGLVQGVNLTGIHVANSAASGDISVTATDIRAGMKGVHVELNSTGQANVTVNGSITGNTGPNSKAGEDAIQVETTIIAGTDPSITGLDAVQVITSSGQLETQSDGIDVQHHGQKGVFISSGSLILADETGISVEMSNADAGRLWIDQGAPIAAGNSGILVDYAGSSDMTLNLQAPIIANGSDPANPDFGVGILNKGNGNLALTTGAGITFNGTDVANDESAIGVRYTNTATGDISITVNAAITSKAHGIGIEHKGTGNDVKVTVKAGASIDVSGGAGDAISVDTGANVANVSIDTDDTVTAKDGDAIYVKHAGTGLTSVHARKKVETTGTGNGILIEDSGTGNATITADAEISAGGQGARIDKTGDGSATITTNAAVTAKSTNLLEAAVGVVHSATGDIDITAKGNVTSNTHGIAAIHTNGSATNVKVTVQNGVTIDTTGGSGHGIVADGGANVANVAIDADAVIKSKDGDAIHVEHDGSGVAVSTVSVHARKAITVSGAGDGIDVEHDGKGAATITADGNISAGGKGVVLTKNGDGDASVTTNGTVSGGEAGVEIEHNAAGKATIVAEKAIVANGSTTAGDAGIGVQHVGTGDVEVTAKGDITSTAHGIGVWHTGSAANVKITVQNGATIDTTGGTGDGVGIGVVAGKDVANVAIDADAIIKSKDGDAIYVSHDGSAVAASSVDVKARKAITVSGSGDGIHVEHKGKGTASVYAFQQITTTGGGDGIYLAHTNDGDTSITTDGAVQASGDGLIINKSGANDASITANAAITAGGTGIGIGHQGNGDAIIVANDAVTANGTTTYDTGLGIQHTGTGDIDITANGQVDAQNIGIYAKHDGTGDIDIELGANAGIVARGADATDAAIYAELNKDTGGNIEVLANAGAAPIQAKNIGLLLINNGAGYVNVDLKGAITGIGGGGYKTADDAIRIVTDATAGAATIPNTTTAVSVVTAALESQAEGIDISHGGKGDVEVGIFGNIAAGGTGVKVVTNANAGDVSVTQYGAITAGDHGIYVKNDGKGSITVQHNQPGATITAGKDAIHLETTSAAATTVDITTSNPLTAGEDGIDVTHAGTGDLTIDVANIITADQSGIKAVHSGSAGIDIIATSKIVAKGANATDAAISASLTASNGTDIDVLARGDIEAKNIGVHLVNDGKGKTTFKLDSGKSIAGIGGANNATTDDAIRIVTNAASGTQLAAGQTVAVDVTTTAGGVLEAGKDGIDIDHAGKGDVKLTSAAEIKAGQDGINVSMTNASAGKLTIASDAKITATGGHGIAAATTGTDATIDVSQQITAGMSGVRLAHTGNTGAASIAVGAAITAALDAIQLQVTNSAADATITTTAAVKGGENAIDAAQNGGGNLAITTSADVTGGTGYAIATATKAGKTTTLDVNGGTVSATSGKAISNNLGDSIINLAAAAIVKGDISLGDGSDVLNVNGADVSGVTLFDGGDDASSADGFIDKLNFANVNLNNLDPAKVKNWEEVNLNNGSSVHFTAGNLQAEKVLVAAGSAFGFAGNVSITGDMTNQGTITAQNNANGDVLTIDGDYAGNGTVKLDVKLDDGKVDTTDKLVIKGDNNGNIIIDVRNVGGSGGETGTGPTDGIRVVEIQGANNGSLQLAGGQVIVGMYAYTLTNDGYLQSKLAATDAMTTAPAMAFFLPGGIESLFQRLGSIWAMAPTASGGGVRTAGFTITPTAATPLDLTSGFWLRGRYDYMKANANATVGATPFNPTSKLHQLRMELGYSQLLAETAAGRFSGSIFTHYRRTSSDMEANGSKRGDARADGFGAGASLTWIGTEGLYADLLAEVGRHRVTFTDRVLNATGKTWATTWRVSLEGGYQLPVNERFSLVPQAQVNVRGSRFKRYTIGASTYEDHSKPVVTGRIGIGAQMAPVAVAEDLDVTAQLTASLLHDFGKGGYMTANNQKIEAEFASTLVQLRSNLTAMVPGSGLSFSLENSFSHSLKGPKQYAFTTSVGLKMSF